jgi:hypothetical protein
MKYLKYFGIKSNVDDKPNIDSICRKYNIKNYTINPDGTVDVDGKVYLNYQKLTKLPLKFGYTKEIYNI